MWLVGVYYSSKEIRSSRGRREAWLHRGAGRWRLGWRPMGSVRRFGWWLSCERLGGPAVEALELKFRAICGSGEGKYKLDSGKTQ